MKKINQGWPLIYYYIFLLSEYPKQSIKVQPLENRERGLKEKKVAIIFCYAGFCFSSYYAPDAFYFENTFDPGYFESSPDHDGSYKKNTWYDTFQHFYRACIHSPLLCILCTNQNRGIEQATWY
jgi:hypothetical protein